MKGGFASEQGRGKTSKKAIPSDFALIELKRGPINLLDIGIERCRTLDNQENENGVIKNMNGSIKKSGIQAAMQERETELEKYLELVQSRANQAPDGYLKISRTKKVQYYKVTKDTEPNGIYLQKNDMDVICSLAQKEYDRKVILAMQKELTQIRKMIKTYSEDGIRKIYDNYIAERKELIEPVELSDEAYARKWINQEYKKKDIGNAINIYQTEGEDLVRSKSELIIANKLKKLKIPYRYEAELTLKDGTILHPDFTVLNVRERKTYFFEHLGMMDNAEYLEHAMDRITRYEKNGIFPGKQLILSHESSSRPLDPVLVEAIIREYLM